MALLCLSLDAALHLQFPRSSYRLLAARLAAVVPFGAHTRKHRLCRLLRRLTQAKGHPSGETPDPTAHAMLLTPLVIKTDKATPPHGINHVANVAAVGWLRGSEARLS